MNIAQRLEQAGVQQTPGQISAVAQAAAAQFCLPFGRQNWRGQTGNWAGAGVGSSIDFQDHRPYVPGDDPRYINWQAYARSGSYTMKLYRQEVRPQVDLVLDLSGSMFVEPAKAVRALELFYFACHSCWRSGVSPTTFITDGQQISRPEAGSLRNAEWQVPESQPQAKQLQSAPQWQRIPWAVQSMRVIISDFLFEQEPASQLDQIARGGGQVLLLCPYTQSEMRPQWLGDLDLQDIESGQHLRKHFTSQDAERYNARYDAHFAAWADAASRHHAMFSRIAATGTLAGQLLAVAKAQGGVELCN